MFTLKSTKIFSLLSAAMILISSSAFAMPFDDKTSEKARQAVSNASPDDWHTLAKSAEICFRKKVNLKEANDWLEQSIAISPNSYNLTLKGDYYMMNKLPEKALDYYIQALNAAKAVDNHADLSDIQKKIADITNIGG